MSQYLFIHGKNPELSKAELRAMFPTAALEQREQFSLMKSEQPIGQDTQNKLGGTVKICEITDQNPVDLIEQSAQTDKIIFGVSQYGGHERLPEILVAIKKGLKQEYGRNARFINKDFKNISSGQLNQTGLLEKGVDLVRVWFEGKELWGRTVAFQDIDAYSKRDYDKPRRDMKVGMLPPKLAQIMINLAQPGPNTMIYDPFCGLGTIPMEGALRGNPVAGSDLKGAMVGATEKNMEWLTREFGVGRLENGVEKENSKFQTPNSVLFQHDATQPFSKKNVADDLVIVCEGYLGPLQNRPPSQVQQKEIFDLLDGINSKFFAGISQILRSGQRLVCCFPFFRSKDDRAYYPEELIRKYAEENAFELETPPRSLLYERESQVVGREIVVFKKT
ncbi:MAG: hypothetical protein Q8P95_01485 [bacterium]|nr:hypothetical protein [bacterium]